MEKINKMVLDKGENSIIDIILYLKDTYKGKYIKLEELNNEFAIQLDRLYHGFCEDEDTAINWSIDKLVSLLKYIDDPILIYAIKKMKELIDLYC